MIKDKHQYHVCGWMINKLHLEGKELQCYAIIFSLSQLGEGRYIAGLKFLAEFMQCSQPTASAAVKSLFEKKLIKKDEITTDFGRRVFYYCIDPENKGTEEPEPNEGGEKENLEGEKDNYVGVNKYFMDGVNKNFMPKYNSKEYNNKKEDVNKLPSSKKARRPKKKELSEVEVQFIAAMKEQYPRIMKMEQPLTYEQSQKLKSAFTSQEIKNALDGLENWKPLLTKRVQAYMTIVNWIKKDQEYGQ